MITLTSFREGAEMDERLLPGGRWSGARWAPEQARLWPVAEWAQPIRPDGSPIKLRDFGQDPLPKYHEYMLSLYRGRWPEIRDWLFRYGDTGLLIACWCPYTKTARAQISKFGSFHCHLGVVGEVLSAAGAEWRYGAAHQKGMVKP